MQAMKPRINHNRLDENSFYKNGHIHHVRVQDQTIGWVRRVDRSIRTTVEFVVNVLQDYLTDAECSDFDVSHNIKEYLLKIPVVKSLEEMEDYLKQIPDGNISSTLAHIVSIPLGIPIEPYDLLVTDYQDTLHSFIDKIDNQAVREYLLPKIKSLKIGYWCAYTFLPETINQFHPLYLSWLDNKRVFSPNTLQLSEETRDKLDNFLEMYDIPDIGFFSVGDNGSKIIGWDYNYYRHTFCYVNLHEASNEVRKVWEFANQHFHIDTDFEQLEQLEQLE
ncbi:hypothetical protein [Niemeyer virus]|jgi:hypothetical protein|uniref:Uncharacterized protein L191 n=6 Tax=Mimivirus TaxID=315393 RepID=YL191_MIMIV|nr:hypothetical protein MIMI_gp0211 [Acanthamoeba polyphaga mimivirus]Q5UQ11.1 RecName: Full=Uncharacterized protein L191 [Acanthamoeba polyphaga mimivirus]AHJ39957.1 hypothetical protein [Samba virus]ALR83702.1 hypothetical protein [Niemeyer virus]AMZ02639.1 hypothetical protein [Mimivirus Bombay]AAV50465.1 unknown [Acanthamoeba polyphaga mimivirus]ADO18043.1 hypothetical protein [Acanthamoeba polyphaga mimivirus]